MKAAFAKTDGCVERGEASEPNVEGGDGSAGAKFAVFVLEDSDERIRGGDLFCAQLLWLWSWRG